MSKEMSQLCVRFAFFSKLYRMDTYICMYIFIICVDSIQIDYTQKYETVISIMYNDDIFPAFKMELFDGFRPYVEYSTLNFSLKYL